MNTHAHMASNEVMWLLQVHVAMVHIHIDFKVKNHLPTRPPDDYVCTI